jgi:hypothetical protein
MHRGSCRLVQGFATCALPYEPGVIIHVEGADCGDGISMATRMLQLLCQHMLCMTVARDALLAGVSMSNFALQCSAQQAYCGASRLHVFAAWMASRHGVQAALRPWVSCLTMDVMRWCCEWRCAILVCIQLGLWVV